MIISIYSYIQFWYLYSKYLAAASFHTGRSSNFFFPNLDAFVSSTANKSAIGKTYYIFNLVTMMSIERLN